MTTLYPKSCAAILGCFTLLTSTIATASVYYVAPTGSDRNTGLSTTSPFQTLQMAANLVNPGDTVFTMSGTYTTPTNRWSDAVLHVTRSGTAAQPILFSAYPGQHPIISTTGNRDVWSGVQIIASYVELSGFEVVGNAQTVTLKQATATYKAEEAAYLASLAAAKINPSAPIVTPSDVATNGQCISVDRSTHVTILGNLVHDCSANGIDAEASDYTTIESNIVFNTSWWTVYGTSGINIHTSLNSDGYTGYKNFIINNISHDNGNTQPFYAYGAGGKPTDGNGIIVDTNQATNDGQPYLGRTLIMGNIVYNNGGSGIHAYLSNHVDIYNNTALFNNLCPVAGSGCGDIDEGQIFGNTSKDITIYNNILVSQRGKLTYSNWANTNLSEGHNIMVANGGGVVLKSWTTLDPSDLVTNPRWVNPGLVVLKSFSPAADAAAIATPAVAFQALMPVSASPARNAGTSLLDDGQPMSVVPAAMNGNCDRGIDIGALSVAVAQ